MFEHVCEHRTSLWHPKLVSTLSFYELFSLHSFFLSLASWLGRPMEHGNVFFSAFFVSFVLKSMEKYNKRNRTCKERRRSNSNSKKTNTKHLCATSRDSCLVACAVYIHVLAQTHGHTYMHNYGRSSSTNRSVANTDNIFFL